MAVFLADNPVLAGLWRYWLAKRAGRPMPRRRDIDPVELPASLLPHLQMIERIGTRFRYRLTGTAIVEAYGRELTGLFVDEVIPPSRRAVAERHYSRVFDTAQPLFVRNAYTTPSAAELVVARVILPLAEDSEHVSLLLMAQTFEYSADFAARLGMEAAIDASFDEVQPLPA